MKNGLIASLLMATLSLAGCAGFIKTNQVSAEQAVPVPMERLFAFQDKTQDVVPVIVIRDSGMLYGACYLAIEADRKLVARIDTGEKVIFYLSPELHDLTVAPDPSGGFLCGSGFGPVTEKYKINKDSQNRFRLSSRQYRRPELEPLDQ